MRVSQAGSLFLSLGLSLPHTSALSHLYYLVLPGDSKNKAFCPELERALGNSLEQTC